MRKRLLLAVVFLFLLSSCAPKSIRPVHKDELLSVCLRAKPEFPLVARVGVRLKEYGQNKGAVAGLLFIRDRQTFKIALLGPFGSQRGEVYFLSGRLVAYKEGEKVLDTMLPIEGLPEVGPSFRDALVLTKDDLVMLSTETDGRRLSCSIEPEEMRFQALVLQEGDSSVALEGYRDGFFRKIVISKGKSRIEIKVREVKHKKALKDSIFQLP